MLYLIAIVCVVYSRRPKYYELEGYTFERYIQDFRKAYTADELSTRKAMFEKSLKEVFEHNAKPNMLWKKGINHLSAHTPDELSRMNGGRLSNSQSAMPLDIPNDLSTQIDSLPSEVDYRKHQPNIISEIKDQGNCGSCYAFGSTETIEAHYALKTGQLFSLSPEQVAQCTPNPDDCGGFGGCRGGDASLVFDFVTKHGITEEALYPYTSYSGVSGKCNMTNKTPFIKLSGYTKVPANIQPLVMYALAVHGPLAVNVDASKWPSYESGVFRGCGDYSTPISIDHVVQLVGYGHDDLLNVDYWIVRNSWNPTWGENGYIRVYRNANPACGENIKPQSGVACKNSPKSQYVCGECGILFAVTYPNFHLI